jgi:hypothetical protein
VVLSNAEPEVDRSGPSMVGPPSGRDGLAAPLGGAASVTQRCQLGVEDEVVPTAVAWALEA